MLVVYRYNTRASCLPFVDGNAWVHVEKVLWPWHCAATVHASLLLSLLSIGAKLSTFSREMTSLPQAGIATAPALCHFVQHDHLIIFLSKSLSVCSSVCGAASPDAGLYDGVEDEHHECNGGIAEDDCARLRGEMKTQTAGEDKDDEGC
jgi:hypothetical protein